MMLWVLMLLAPNGAGLPTGVFQTEGACKHAIEQVEASSPDVRAAKKAGYHGKCFPCPLLGAEKPQGSVGA
jgi:hypothetical protein